MSASSAPIFPRKKRPTQTVRRGVVVALLALGLVLVTLSYQQGSSKKLRSVQLGVLQVVAPVEKGLSKAWEPVRSAYDWTASLLRATNENPRLRRRIDHLEERTAELQVAQDDNARMRKLLKLTNRGDLPANRNRVVGSVIARSPTALDRSVVVDVGSNEGVHVDDPVLVPGGLLGRVQDVSNTTATVALILNRAEAVSVVIEGRKAGGVMRAITADGGSPVMQLDYVAQAASVHVGDIVATSGWRSGPLQSIYPKGLPIGMVSSVGNVPTDLYKTVQVTPFADFDRIDEVVVLVKRGGAR
jgi:rod shape-determining protein MreC